MPAVRPLPAPVENPADLRYPEVLRSFHLGRQIDPRQPDVLHEGHPIFRVEVPARWNLHPGPARTVTAPPGSMPDVAFSPPPVSDALVAEFNRQRELTERVLAEATRMARSYGELQGVIGELTRVAGEHSTLTARMRAAEEHHARLEETLRRLITPAAPATPEVATTPLPEALRPEPLSPRPNP